jgi:hypothetical protein
MRRIVDAVVVLVLCCLVGACTTHSVQRDLARRFVELTDEGKIPGFPPGSDGEIHMDQPAPFEHIAYPVSRNIFVVRSGDTSVYTYHFMKVTKDSDWQLMKAWVADRDGQRTEVKLP